MPGVQCTVHNIILYIIIDHNNIIDYVISMISDIIGVLDFCKECIFSVGGVTFGLHVYTVDLC